MHDDLVQYIYVVYFVYRLKRCVYILVYIALYILARRLVVAGCCATDALPPQAMLSRNGKHRLQRCHATDSRPPVLWGRLCRGSPTGISRQHTSPRASGYYRHALIFVNIIPNLLSSDASCRSYSSGPSSYDVSSYSIKRSLEEAAKKYL